MLESYLPGLKHAITVLLFCFVIFGIRTVSLKYIKKKLLGLSKQCFYFLIMLCLCFL